MSSKPSISKKKGRIVPSRFKQAAETISCQASRRSVEEQSRFQSRSHSPRRLDKESKKQLSTGGKDEIGISRSESVRICPSSTPTSEGHYTLPPIDESIIAKGESFLSAPSNKAYSSAAVKKETKKPSLQKNKTADLTSVSMGSRGRKKSNQVNECDQSEINLLYAEYLQAKYIESMTKKAFETRCKDALDKIYEVWCHIGLLMEKNAKIQKELNIVNYFIMAHEHLCKQEKMLLPALKIIPSLEKQYEEIAKAVNTARHNLEVKDVSLPDVDREEEIVLLLRKATALLNIIINFVQDSNKIVAAAENKHAFVNQGKLISDKLESASEMLSEASHLLVTETSLKLSSH